MDVVSRDDMDVRTFFVVDVVMRDVGTRPVFLADPSACDELKVSIA